MSTRLRDYGFASVAVILTAAVRFALIPLLGNRFGFDLFLISAFACGRYLGFGPSVFALLTGAVPVTLLHLLGPDLHDPFFLVGLVAYLILGAIVILLCKSEHDARDALRNEIGQRKAAETELRGSRQQLLLAIEAGQLGTWQLDMRTNRVEWSALMEPMHGYAPGTFGGTLAEAIAHNHPEDQQRILREVAQRLDAVRLTYRVIVDGATRWIQGIGQSFRDESGEAVQSIGVCFDVTEQKEAEMTLRQAEEKFRAVATHAPVGIFETDSQGHCRFVNKAWCDIAGAQGDDALGDGWQRFILPEDRQRVIEEWSDATRHRRNHATEFRFLNQIMGVRWVIASATAMLNSGGSVTGYVGTIVDVTQRKAAEDAVRASEIRLQGMLDHTPAVISLKDLQGRYVLVNRGWEELFGVSNDAIVGLNNYDLLGMTCSGQMSKEIADQFVKIDQKVMRTGELVTFEDTLPSGDDPRLFATVKFPIKDASGKITGIGGISIDITERRKAIDSLAAEQETLRHTIAVQDQERQLVAYDIHDGVVQYATGALMQLEGIQNRVQSDALADQIENVLGILRKTVDEGRRIINGMHTTILDDCGVVDAVQQLIDDKDHAAVQIEFVKDDSLGRMAPNIELALYRIAREALTNAHKHSRSDKVRIQLSRLEDRVHLEIRDWGVGFVPRAPGRSMD